MALNNIVTMKYGLEVTQSLWVIQTGTIQKLEYSFLVAFHSNYGSILYHFWDKEKILVENRDFFYIPVAFKAAVRGSL